MRQKFFTAALTLILAFQAAFAQGHVEANVPEEENFYSYLARDLNDYFGATTNKKISVKFELLRKVATQVGVAYPKFYAWVKVYDGGVLKKQGAVRLAAIEQKVFEVTDFVTAEQIQADPAKIETVFPAALCPKIIELAKK